MMKSVWSGENHRIEWTLHQSQIGDNGNIRCGGKAGGPFFRSGNNTRKLNARQAFQGGNIRLGDDSRAHNNKSERLFHKTVVRAQEAGISGGHFLTESGPFPPL